MPLNVKQTLIFPATCGVLVTLLGIAVIIGWYTHSVALVQVLPVFAPMQYNTALGFLLSGLGLLTLINKRHDLTMVFGSLVFLIGFLTLIEYVGHLDLGIDQLFMEHNIVTKTSHPGRMAPNTALCFFFFGLSLTLVRLPKAVLVSIGFTVLLLSFLALLGYLAEAESIYGWGSLTRMAIHTAAGFVTLSFGLLWFCLFGEGQKNVDLWEYSPYILCVMAIAMTLLSWYGVREVADQRNKVYVNTLVSETGKNLKERYRLYEQSLLGGLGLFYSSSPVKRNEWKTYSKALNIKETLPGISGVGYISYVEKNRVAEFLEKVRADNAPNFVNHPKTPFADKFIITFIEPEELNEKAVGLDIGFEANRREAAEYSRDFGVPALTKKIELVQDNKKQAGFLLLVPVYDVKETPLTIEKRREHFLGWVYAPFIGPNFLEGIVGVRHAQIGFAVYDGEEVKEDALIYSTAKNLETSLGPDSIYNKKTSVKLAGRLWTIKWYVTDKIDLPGSHNVANIMLALGLVLSGLVYFVLLHLIQSKKIIAKEVERQTERLARVNAELEKFAYVASHDLKAPMRGIDNLAKWIAEDLEDVMNDDAREKLVLLRQRIARLETLLEDILSYSRAGRIVDDPEEVNTHELVEEIIESLALPKTFNVKISEQLPTLRTVRTPLQQIFLNLISNAYKHHDKEKGNIEVSYIDVEDYYEFTVFDDGPGIAEEFHERVFEMFQTLQSRDKTEGTGLGMAIIKKMVEWQSGEVWIESKKGTRGTKVSFLWPKICKEEKV